MSLLLHLIFVLISLILSFFVFIIVYAIIVIMYLVISLLIRYVDVYIEAVVILICIKTNQLTGNVYNDSEVTKVKEDIRSCYAKYVFLLGKIYNLIVSLVLLGLFTDRNDAFSYPFRYPFRAEPPHIGHYVEYPRDKKRHQEPIPSAIYDLRNEHFYLMHTLACVQMSLL